MNETQEQILSKARHFVTELYAHQVKPEFVFHNLEHTEAVAEASSQIADHYRLGDDDRFVLMLAAWFHDTGYSAGKSEGHEEASVQIAIQFLQQQNVDPTVVQRVSSSILATHMPQSPISPIEKILCDADLMHLATEDFKAMNQLLKQERENLMGQKISKKEWRRHNIKFLEDHKYFTEYGREVLEPKKLGNLQSLNKKKDEKEVVVEKLEAFPYLSPMRSKKDELSMQKSTERGIQTMFRTTSSNHFELSSLADGKGNIMISVNSIIISIIISVLFGKLAYYTEYIIPACILLAVCLGSMTFAILATRPSVNKGKFTEEDIRNKQTNLLFFGNFHRMQLEDYQRAMNVLMKDGEYLYSSMVKDIYFLGIVLARKYRFLRISYTIFMWGLIIAVISFVVAGIIATAGASSAPLPVVDY